jgi:hypothetical protein
MDANFLGPFRHFGVINAVPYTQGIFWEYWHSWAAPMTGVQWLYVASTVLIAPFSLVAALPALVLTFAAWQRRDFAQPELLLYFLCGGVSTTRTSINSHLDRRC